MTTIVSGSSITFNDNTTQNTSAYGGGFAFRNRIINGDMRIDQRNAGASVTQNTTGTQYSLDRWGIYGTQASKFTAQQNAGSVTPPAGFTNYLGFTSSSAYTLNGTDTFWFQQLIEGFNTADLGFGTVNAKTITLSFWVRSSLTGTFGGVLKNSATDRNYSFSYTISSANTWEQKTITVAGDTSGTWIGATNGVGLMVRFSLGSNYTGTAGAWAGGYIDAPTGQTSVVGTNGATFYITGVQLEKGSTATSFDYRPYTTELQLCQRYYELLGGGSFVGRATGATSVEGSSIFCVTKRASPTMTVVNGTNTLLELSIAIRSFTSISGGTANINGAYMVLAGSSGLTSPNLCIFYNNNAIVSMSAEL